MLHVMLIALNRLKARIDDFLISMVNNIIKKHSIYRVLFSKFN